MRRGTTTALALGVMAGGLPVIAQVESTGSEAEDGWDAGYSICGPEFAATCINPPFTYDCVPGDHAANQNCCPLDPNEDTGWSMPSQSPQCREPHIDSLNTFAGSQHLRFQRDPASPRFSGTALTPLRYPQAPRRTVISFESFCGTTESAGLQFEALRGPAPFAVPMAAVGFATSGTLFVQDSSFGGSIPVGSWEPGVYRNVTIDVDPCDRSVHYFYGGRLVHSGVNQAGVGGSVGLSFFNFSYDGIWDIDDYVVTRGEPCFRSCDDSAPAQCGSEPCAALKAVAVNGNLIAPTNCVHVRPGDLIEAEIYFSGWGGRISGVRGFQATLWGRAAATSGAVGTLLPLGWMAPDYYIPCGAECPTTFPNCDDYYGCVAPGHDPEPGAFVTISRRDYLLAGLPVLWATNVATLNYVYIGLGEESVEVPDDGLARYAATVLLVASGDSCGSFELRFKPEVSAGNDPPREHVPLLESAASCPQRRAALVGRERVRG